MRQSLTFILLFFLCLPLLAGTIVPVHGDLNQDGQITNADVTTLADMVLQKQQATHWIVQNGIVTSARAKDGDSDLCGDLNHDGKLTVNDIIYMLRLIQKPTDVEYVDIKNGKICYANKGGLNFEPEDDGFIDDGEIEF